MKVESRKAKDWSASEGGGHKMSSSSTGAGLVRQAEGM